jgi:hypothetical protein
MNFIITKTASPLQHVVKKDAMQLHVEAEWH